MRRSSFSPGDRKRPPPGLFLYARTQSPLAHRSMSRVQAQIPYHSTTPDVAERTWPMLSRHFGIRRNIAFRGICGQTINWTSFANWRLGQLAVFAPVF